VTSNVPAIIASFSSIPLEHKASAFSGLQAPQMHEDGVALRGGKVGQIDDHLVEAALPQMFINLPQKRLDVEPSRGDRSHRIVGHPLRIDPVTSPRWITSQWPHPLF
jgi:hypothetical protein